VRGIVFGSAAFGGGGFIIEEHAAGEVAGEGTREGEGGGRWNGTCGGWDKDDVGVDALDAITLFCAWSAHRVRAECNRSRGLTKAPFHAAARDSAGLSQDACPNALGRDHHGVGDTGDNYRRVAVFCCAVAELAPIIVAPAEDFAR